MYTHPSRETLQRTVAAVRRRLFLQSLLTSLTRVSLPALPLGAALVAFDQRWLHGQYTPYIAAASIGIIVLTPLLLGLLRLRSPFASALALDDRAALKDRISSAWEFLQQESLDEPHLVQIQDAIRHARSAPVKALFRPRLTRVSLLLPTFIVLFVMSFFMPAQLQPNTVEAAIDARRAQQLQELATLQQELTETIQESKEMEGVLKKLQEIERRFKQGEMSERDMMIELSRLDEDLRQNAKQMGVENLDAELSQLVPHLTASAASRQVAAAIKEQDLEKAAQEMEKLGEKAEKEKLSKEEKEQLALNMGVAGSKLGSKSENSFGGDLSKASESLKNSNNKEFCSTCKSMGQKLSNVNKFRQMKQAQKRISMCKSSMGQKKSCSECKGQGCSACQKPGNKKGGLKAGVGTADPLGDPSRLADSYKKMLEVKGQTGEGPVESEVETTEGETSESQLTARELYAEYEAVAEQAIEREEIPLSHRFHVKRYFQAIRPAE